MNVSRIIIYILSVLLMVSVIGCENFSEGDDLAEEAFDKMSVVEKQYYKRVQDIWGEYILKFLREAVRERIKRPSNDELPFGDMVNVLRKVNDVQLVIKDGWEESKRLKFSTSKFSSIDPTWWNALIQKSRGVTNEEVKEPVRRLTVKEPVVRHIAVNIPKQRAQGVDMNLLLTLDEYDELGMEIGDCQSAKDFLRMIASGGRALTIKDRDNITRKVLACRTMQLSESFQD